MISNTISPPILPQRIWSVCYRHIRVYTRHLWSNGIPAFIEPIIFILGLGLGLGVYISNFHGMPYIQFLASGVIVTAAMFTAAFECTFGTFFRMEIDKVYDGMLTPPIKVADLINGEILFAGIKGLFFTTAVLIVIILLGLVSPGWSLLSPLIGFFTGLMIATLSLLVTSFVKTMNHINFYISGLLIPMLFLSGVVFPVEDLPFLFRVLSEMLPLTHPVRLARASFIGHFHPGLLLDMLYIVLFIPLIGYFAIQRLRRRLID